MREEVVIGQYLDLLDQATTGSLASALRIALLKTAKYTVEHPLHIGGALAGGSSALQQAYTAFAVPIGEAFQLRDDILGVFGDPEQTGKPAIDDLREGKPTALIAIARKAATPSQAARIRALYGDPRLDMDGAAQLCGIIQDTGAVAAVEEMIAERARRAHAALGRAPVPDEVKHALTELITVATRRDA